MLPIQWLVAIKIRFPIIRWKAKESDSKDSEIHGLSLVPEEGEEEQGYSSTISMKTAAIQL
jgi:hypothetical protein